MGSSGIFIIIFTYALKRQDINKNIISQETQKEIKNSLSKNSDASDVFYDISYTGIDLSGNRYILKSKEARNNQSQMEIVIMKGVNAIFYFKDGTILKVRGNYGIYNNKNNDMSFRENVSAEYQQNYLFSDNLDFFNTKNSLTIYGNVRTESIKGSMTADNLKFDLLEQTLDVSMLNDKQIDMKLKN